jgi:tetratricopeptide (TPR) repeat protein
LLYQKTLEICRISLGEEHPDTAGTYNGWAGNLMEQGYYAEARPLLQKALEIYRKSLGERHPHTATTYNNLAANLTNEGKYVEAGRLLEKALDGQRKLAGDDTAQMALLYYNLATNFRAQGNHVDSERVFRKTLEIQRKTLGERHPDTVRTCGALASILMDDGQYRLAETMFDKVVKTRREILGQCHPDTAWSYSCQAANYDCAGNVAAALTCLENGVRAYEAARLGAAVGGLERAAFGAQASPYSLLAALYVRTGRPADAWSALESDFARGLLDEMTVRRGAELTLSEQKRRDEIHAREAPLQAHIRAFLRRSRLSSAEESELKQLTEQRRELENLLSDVAVGASRRSIAPLTDLQSALVPHAAIVAWVDGSTPTGRAPEHWGCVVRSGGEPRWEELPGSGPGGKWTKDDTDLPARLRSALARGASSVEVQELANKIRAQRLAPLEKHLAGINRLIVVPVREMAGIPVEVLASDYTVSYTPSGTYLARISHERPAGTCLLAVGDPMFPSAELSAQSSDLPPGGVLVIQVLPDGNAARARIQAGDVLVSYAGEDIKSAEHLGKLAAAQATAKSVLVKVWREGQGKLAEREVPPGKLGVALERGPARDAIAARRTSDKMLPMVTRGEAFVELPGTQVEITRVASFFEAKSVTSLTRTNASEQRLDELRKAGQLRNFRYLHFATHGKANNVRAFDSALMLTPPAKLPEVHVGEPYLDGRLTAAEVMEYWKLDAELVTLSACESGLGRQGGGDGLLGFAQAFLLAGSRAVCLTLWEVDDTATALLMDRFYRNLLGKREDGAKPMGKAAALHEAKHWLRTLTADQALERLGAITQGIVRGERPARQQMRPIPKTDAAGEHTPYAHPRYWAAFVLIGDPN